MHDDFLEQLPLFLHEITKGRELIPMNPRVVAIEGFIDKFNWVRDAEVSMGGLELLKKWFAKRKLDTPLRNVWEFDIGNWYFWGFSLIVIYLPI